MVAYRFTLLSLAAISNLCLDVTNGAFLGRSDWRLIPRDDGRNSSSIAAPPPVAPPLPATKPTLPSKAPEAAGKSTSDVIDLGATDSSATVVGGGGPVQFASSSPTQSSTTTTDYVDPNDYGSSGTMSSQTTIVPSRATNPSKSSVEANSIPLEAPTSDSARSATMSTRTTPPHLPTLPAVPPAVPGVPVSSSSTDSAIASPPTVNPGPPAGPPVIIVPPTFSKGPPLATFSGTTESFDLGQWTTITTLNPDGSEGDSWTTWTTPTKPTTSYSNQTVTFGNMQTSSVSYCQASDSMKPKTSYSIIYTSTTTWTGNPKDYTPPFPPMTTPKACVDEVSPLRLTVSSCSPTGTTSVCTTAIDWAPAAPVTQTHALSDMGTVTMLTTDKNPIVVYSSISTPDYGVTRQGSQPQNLHNSVTGLEPIITPSYEPPAVSKDQVQAAPAPTSHTPITVAPQPSAVVINGHTYYDDPATPSQTVVVGDQTLVVNPSQVIGAGTTVARPAYTGGVFVPQPTSTVLGGLGVSASSSVAVVDGTTFTLGLTAITTQIKDQLVTLGPGGIVVGSQTIAVAATPLATQIVIAGGELVTAIGQSVFVVQSTTITYGPGSEKITVIRGDSITLGPSGITVHGTTLGGPNARTDETQYEIVGGATITEIGASLVVIDGQTYTIGPGTGTTITVIKGQTITIAPSGVAVSTLTLPYPFGPTATITPGDSATPTTAEETGPTAAEPTPSKDAAVGAARPNFGSVLCMAIGVAILGI